MPEYVHIQWDGCVTVDQKCWVEVVACRCSDVVMGRAQHLSAAGGLEFFIIGDTIDNHLGLFRYVLRKPVVVGRSASQALQYRYVCLVLAAKFLLLFSFLAHVHRFRFCVFTLLRAARVSPETKKRVGPPSVATFFRPTYCCYHDYVLRLERGTGSEPDGAICCIGDSLSLSQEEDKHFFFPVKMAISRRGMPNYSRPSTTTRKYKKSKNTLYVNLQGDRLIFTSDRVGFFFLLENICSPPKFSLRVCC